MSIWYDENMELGEFGMRSTWFEEVLVLGELGMKRIWYEEVLVWEEFGMRRFWFEENLDLGVQTQQKSEIFIISNLKNSKRTYFWIDYEMKRKKGERWE